VHFRWLSPGIFTFGDWWHTTAYTAREWIFLRAIGPWKNVLGFGEVDPQLYFAPINFLRGAFAYLPEGAYIGLLFTYFLPIIILAPVGSYFLVMRFMPDRFPAFVGSVFYTFSTYFLTLQTAHLTIALAYAFAPFIVLHIANFFLVKNTTYKRTIITAIVISLGIIIEPRIFYVLCVIFLPCIFLMKNKILHIMYLALLVFLLNAFWMVPFILSGTGDSVAQLVNRPLFGNTERSMQHALTSMQPAWSWYSPKPFDIQPLYPQYWIFPLIVFLSFRYFSHVDKNAQRLMIWMLCVCIVGIILSKQSHPPFPYLYQFLFDHVPGFNLFRESSKFFLLTNISFLYFIGFFVYIARRQRSFQDQYMKFVSIALVVGVFSVSLISSLPLITGSIGSMFVKRSVSSDYDDFARDIIHDSSFFRILGIPQFPRLMTYSTMHPKLNLGHMRKVFEKNNIPIPNDDISFVQQLIESTEGRALLNIGSVQYLVIPPLEDHNDDYFFASKDSGKSGEKRSVMIEILNKNESFKKVSENDQGLVIYENSKSLPPILLCFGEHSVENPDFSTESSCDISMQNFDIHELSPWEKKISVHNIEDPFFIVLNEKYDKNWIIKTDDFFSDHHFRFMNYFNGWSMQYRSCQNDTCVQDGHFAPAEIIIKNRTHSYFIAGVFISVLTFLSLILHVIYRGYISKKNI
jgi:hypothetical protein